MKNLRMHKSLVETFALPELVQTFALRSSGFTLFLTSFFLDAGKWLICLTRRAILIPLHAHYFHPAPRFRDALHESALRHPRYVGDLQPGTHLLQRSDPQEHRLRDRNCRRCDTV